MGIFTPRAFRRYFATEAAANLPRPLVAVAGGWIGTRSLDDHYISPRCNETLQKLRLSVREPLLEEVDEHVHR